MGGNSVYLKALTKFVHLCTEIYYTVIPGEHKYDILFAQDGNIPYLLLNIGKKFNVLNLTSNKSKNNFFGWMGFSQAPETLYLQLLKDIVNIKEVRKDRTVTLSIFGPQMVFFQWKMFFQ